MSLQIADPEHEPPPGDWPALTRVESWAGELRVNVIRLVAIALFYGRHLVEYWLAAPDAPVRGSYHAQVTWVCLIWAGMGAVLHLWLSRGRFAPWIRFVAVGVDAFLITLLSAIAGGPKSALVLLYFPLIATAPLRLSLPLVYFATAAAGLSYLALLAHYAWYVIGFEKYYATPELRIPRSTEAVVLLAILVTGLLAGQVVRQARRLAARHVMIVHEAPISGAGAGEG